MNEQEYNEFVIRVPSGADTSLFKKLVDRMGWHIDRLLSQQQPAVSPADASLDDLWNSILK